MALSHRVIFTPSGIEAQAPEGATVLEVAREVGIDLDSVCLLYTSDAADE